MSLKYRVKLLTSGGYMPSAEGKEVDAVQSEQYGYYEVKGKDLGSEDYFYPEQGYMFTTGEVEVLEIYATTESDYPERCDPRSSSESHTEDFS